MNKKMRVLWLAAAILFAAGISLYMLSCIATQPWHVLPELGGDGGKNNFTYLYHALYDKGIWFSGMNYPYGEHIVYTDGIPLLSVPLGYCAHVTIGQALTLMWGLITLSYVLSVVYIYLVLRHFSVRPFIAILFSGLITVFSPQVFSIHGHYALAFVCYIPMLFYWSLRYQAGAGIHYAAYIFMLGVAGAFLHPYFAAVTLIWVLSYACGYTIFTKATLWQRIRHVLPPVAAALGTFAVFGLVMKLTDPVKDRPAVPYGTLSNCTRGQDILTSHMSPVWAYVKEKGIFRHVTDGGEGYTYLGIAVLLVLLFTALRAIGQYRRHKILPNWRAALYHFSPVWLFMAFGILLLSMGVPFVWHAAWLLDYISAFRQFRTLGRFSWMFYYIITVYSVVVIHYWYAHYLQQQRKTMAYAILLAPLAVWGYEANAYVKDIRSAAATGIDNYNTFVSANGETWEQYLAAHQYTGSGFQAILIAPFLEIGSEKLWVGRDMDWAIAMGTKAGMQLHLPIIDAMLSRSSWAYAEKQVKIAGGPYTRKPMLGDIKSGKPFLLLHIDTDSLDEDEKYLFEASDYIGHYLKCNVYACYPARLRANDSLHAARIAAMLPTLPAGDTCLTNAGTWYINHCDGYKAATPFFGAGAFPYSEAGQTDIAAIPLSQQPGGQPYEFSCWFLLSNADYSSPYFQLLLLDKDGKTITTLDGLTKESTDNDGLWFRCAVHFRLPEGCRTVKCRLYNPVDNCYKVMDEIMLRPKDALIVSKDAAGRVMVNNHLYSGNTQ